MKPLIADSPKSGPPSVQRTDSMPLIALPIEIVHLEPPRSGHLSTPDNGQPACPQTIIAACKKLPLRADGDRNLSIELVKACWAAADDYCDIILCIHLNKS